MSPPLDFGAYELMNVGRVEGYSRPDPLIVHGLVNPLNPIYSPSKLEITGKENAQARRTTSASQTQVSQFHAPMYGTYNPLYIHPAARAYPFGYDYEENHSMKQNSYRSYGNADPLFEESYGMHSVFNPATKLHRRM